MTSSEARVFLINFNLKSCYQSSGRGLLNELWFPSKRSHSARIHFTRLSNNNGTTNRVVTSPQQAKLWVDRANTVYHYADLEFFFIPDEFGPDWSNLNNTVINRMTGECDGINFNTGGTYPSWCDASDTNSYNPHNTWVEERNEANDFAADFPEKIMVYLRHGPFSGATGGGFSNTTFNFVAMPGYLNTALCGKSGNVDLLAHEMGHYLGLDHTFARSFKTVAEAQTFFNNNGRRSSLFDGDRLSDTLPDPFISGSLQCQLSKYTVTLSGTKFVIPRNNIMTYWHSLVKNLSPAQIRKVFKILKKRLGLYY